MPKIIENVREQLLAEAKRQVAEHGYASTTIRSVASKCGLGIGTVYNYFKSKEMLIATFVFEDWKEHLDEMSRLPSEDPRVLISGIYSSLGNFIEKNEKLFTDTEAAREIAVGYHARHRMLREQIAAFVRPLCERRGLASPEFTAEYISESIVCWAMEGIAFDAVYPLIEKIIN